MTCIVGVINNGKVYLGGDTAGCNVNQYQVYTIKGTKVFKNGNFIFGGTGTFRMLQLIQYKFKPPKFREDEIDLMTYMVTSFIDELRNCFKTAGYAEKDREAEVFCGGILVGFKGRLFSIDESYGVFEILDNYFCAGCGENYAFGSLFTTENTDVDVESRILMALKSASKFSAYVKGPYTILSENTDCKEYQ